MELFDVGEVFTLVDSDGEPVQLVTCTKAAETIGLHPRTVKNAVHQRRLPGGVFGGRVCVTAAAVDAIVAKGWAAVTGIKMGYPKGRPRKKR